VWPHSAEKLWNDVKNLPQSTIDKITHINAMREFSYDPISLLGREACTVGALKAKAAAVPVNTAPILGMGGAAPKRDANRPVTSGDINRMFEGAAAESTVSGRR
jgi:hypothetical protein